MDPHPPKRTRHGGTEDVARKESLSREESVVYALDGAGARGMPFDRIQVASGLTEADLRSLLKECESRGSVRAGRGNLWFGAGAVEEMQSEITAVLAGLHGKDPLRTYVSLNDAASGAAPSKDQRECFRLTLKEMISKGTVMLAGDRARLASYRPQWSGSLAEARENILEKCGESGLSTPNPREMAAMTGLDEKSCRRVLDAMVDAEDLVLLAEGVYVSPEIYRQCRETVVEFLSEKGRITVGECRELLGASRKYVIPLLERFDLEELTVRKADHRVLR